MHIMLRRRKLGNGSTRGIQAASTKGLVPHRNDAPFPADIEYVFRWGCTSNVPDGTKVVNTAKSIHWCSNKRQGRLDMQAAGVSVPETWTTENFVGELSTIRAESHHAGLPDAFVLRPATHAQGRWLSHGTIEEIMCDIDRVSYMGGYVSRKIDKVAEYRVAVIQGRVAWVAQKTPGNPNDVAWNVAQGGRFDNVRWSDWPRAVIEQGLKAANVSGTDFCGVDIMVDANGKAYVLEVNSAPSQTSEYRQRCFAKCFDYIIENGKDPFSMPTLFGWKSTLHPALKTE